MVILNEGRVQSLISYKYFIRPTAHNMYGSSTSYASKHQKNVQKILKFLALEGPMTTWDMAKIKFATDSDKIRTKEKEFRRLLVGRTDRGHRSQGILDLGLVLIDSKSTKRNPGNKYRLSIFGILYCFDVMDFSEKEIDKIANNYQVLIPLVFGKWDFLKSKIGSNVYNLPLLGKGLLFDNPNIIKILNPNFHELISYFNIRSNSLSQSLNEEKLGEQVSLWFYITLLYFPFFMETQKNQNQDKFLKTVLKNDIELLDWFSDFLREAKTYYEQRSKLLEDISIV